MRAEEEEMSWVEIDKLLQVLEKAVNEDDYSQVRIVLKAAVSGFEPQCEIEDWLWHEKLKAYDAVNIS